MIYRVANKNDFLEIVKIKNEVKKRIVEEGLPIWLNGYPKDALLLEDINALNGRVLEDDNGIVGYACFHRADEEYPRGTFKKNNLYSFGRLMIRSKCLGKGYGKQLVSFLIEEAKELNLDGLGILVDECNKRAVHLYEDFGFKKEKTGVFSYGILDVYSLYF